MPISFWKKAITNKKNPARIIPARLEINTINFVLSEDNQTRIFPLLNNHQNPYILTQLLINHLQFKSSSNLTIKIKV
jgi:hypothetical protein